ncbi:MAG: DUF3368 domain-containing protein [Deltaproteobacteria bacterium]|nr:DUF3368 domain-containing protein [Deltaproteobacteria bacterium]
MANSPSIFVTDSNIWIDAHHGRITTTVFKLPYRFITTDFIYEELKQPAGADLISLGLETQSLGPDLVLEMVEMIQNYPRPSRIDISGLVLARHLKVPLLSGDGELRKATGREGIKLHGTLFLLDKMVEHRLITPTEAAQALSRMLLCRSRLPEKECTKRFDAWGMLRK